MDSNPLSLKNVDPLVTEVKPRSATLTRISFANFDFAKIAGLSRLSRRRRITSEEIAEIFTATTHNPELIDFLLCRWVKNPKRIAQSYEGTYCRLLDYRLFPNIEIPIHVSRISGAILSESWGRHREGGLDNGIFDVAAFLFGLTERADFPRVYRIVREGYDAWRTCPRPSETELREIEVEIVRRRKEAFLPYFRPFFGASIRKSPTSKALWKKLPLELREEEFGGSPKRFLRFLEGLAEEDPNPALFQIVKETYPTYSRFRLIETEER